MAIVSGSACGCCINIVWNDAGKVSQVEIIYCPKHAAAPDMFEALTELLEAWDGYELTAALDYRIRERVVAALEVAGGDEGPGWDTYQAEMS